MRLSATAGADFVKKTPKRSEFGELSFQPGEARLLLVVDLSPPTFWRDPISRGSSRAAPSSSIIPPSSKPNPELGRISALHVPAQARMGVGLGTQWVSEGGFTFVPPGCPLLSLEIGNKIRNGSVRALIGSLRLCNKSLMELGASHQHPLIPSPPWVSYSRCFLGFF